jgi:hypothetical protein
VEQAWSWGGFTADAAARWEALLRGAGDPAADAVGVDGRVGAE